MEFIAFQVRDFICDVSMSYLLCIILCIKVSRDTYNNRCISNMQLNDGHMACGWELVVPPLHPRAHNSFLYVIVVDNGGAK